MWQTTNWTCGDKNICVKINFWQRMINYMTVEGQFPVNSILRIFLQLCFNLCLKGSLNYTRKFPNLTKGIRDCFPCKKVKCLKDIKYQKIKSLQRVGGLLVFNLIHNVQYWFDTFERFSNSRKKYLWIGWIKQNFLRTAATMVFFVSSWSIICWWQVVVVCKVTC